MKSKNTTTSNTDLRIFSIKSLTCIALTTTIISGHNALAGQVWSCNKKQEEPDHNSQQYSQKLTAPVSAQDQVIQSKKQIIKKESQRIKQINDRSAKKAENARTNSKEILIKKQEAVKKLANRYKVFSGVPNNTKDSYNNIENPEERSNVSFKRSDISKSSAPFAIAEVEQAKNKITAKKLKAQDQVIQSKKQIIKKESQRIKQINDRSAKKAENARTNSKEILIKKQEAVKKLANRYKVFSGVPNNTKDSYNNIENPEERSNVSFKRSDISKSSAPFAIAEVEQAKNKITAKKLKAQDQVIQSNRQAHMQLAPNSVQANKNQFVQADLPAQKMEIEVVKVDNKYGLKTDKNIFLIPNKSSIEQYLHRYNVGQKIIIDTASLQDILKQHSRDIDIIVLDNHNALAPPPPAIVPGGQVVIGQNAPPAQQQQQQNQLAQAERRQAALLRQKQIKQNRIKEQTLVNAQEAIQKSMIDLDIATLPNAMALNDNVFSNDTELPDTKDALNDSVVSSKSKEEQKATFAGLIGNIDSDNDARQEMVTSSIRSASIDSQEWISHISDTVSSSVTERIDGISPSLSIDNTNTPMQLSDASQVSGVSAGDYKQMAKGIWTSGLYGQSTKGGHENAYKGKMSGGSAGFDLSPNDTSLVGIAYSNISSRFNYKNTGNKINANTHSVSIYTQQEIDNLLLRGIFSYMRSKINTNIHKGAAGNTEIAKSKFNNNSVSGEVSAGYKINNTLGFVIMPNIGVRLSHFQDDAYKETGTGVLNLEVEETSSQKLAGIAGIKLAAPRVLDNGMLITPTVNLSMEKYIHSKKAKTQAKFQWMDNYFDSQPKSKPASMGYNIGTGIAAKRDNLELSANYNCHIENKYTNHQGALKLKLVF